MALKKPSDYFKKESSLTDNSIQEMVKTSELSEFSNDFNLKEVNQKQILSNLSESLDKYRNNIEKVNFLSEKIEEIQTDIQSFFRKEDLDSVLLSQILIIDDIVNDLKTKVSGINTKNLTKIRSDVSSLTELVNEFLENEAPKYKKLVIDSELRTNIRYEKLEENVSQTLEEIQEFVEDKYEKLQESLRGINDQKLTEIINDFEDLDQIITEFKEKEIPKYKSLIVETEIKTDSKLIEFDEKLNQTLNDVIERINLVEGDKTELVKIVNNKIQEIQNIKNCVFEDLKVGENYKKEINKKVSDLEVEITRNESHIKSQNKNLQQIQENVRSAIKKLNFEKIEEQNYELGKKIKYLEEIFDKFNEKEILNENIIVEPPSTDNRDPSTPLDKNFVTLEQLQQHYRLFINRIQQQLATLGGGGETRLEFLDDVDRDSVKQDGYIIQYSSSSGKFVGTPYVPGGGGGGGSSQWVTTSAGIHTLSNVGIGTTNSTSRLTVLGDVFVSGIVTATTFSGNATSSGISSSVIGGIASVTQLNVSGVSTLGVVTSSNIFSTGIITATSFIRTSGTSSQFLKADGSVDSNVYLTSYTETDTLNSITGRGNSTTNGISVGVLTASRGNFSGIVTSSGLSISGVSTLGVVTSGNIFSTGIITATLFSGNLANTLTLNTSGTGLSGSTTFNNSGAATFTVTSNATSVNTPSTIVARDGSGNFSAGIITATSFSGSGTNLSSLNASNLSSGIVPSARITASSGDFTVGNNLFVNGNLSIGGTSIILNATTLQIKDRDIVLGVTTDVNGNDISTDLTSSHGGISIASTQGSPLFDMPLQAGINSLPFTYKQFMWISSATSGSYSGVATDAWISNYAIGIGTLTVRNGSRLTVGSGFTVFDTYLDATDIRARNINAGIITAVSFSGNASSATFATSSGVSTSVIGGIASVTSLNVTGVTTLGFVTATNAFVSGIVTTGTHNLTTGNTYQINGTSVLSNNTLGTGVVNSSLTSVGTLGQLNVTGVSTLGILTVGNVFSTGIITATSFSGDGSQLTGIVASGSGIAIRDDGVLVGTASTIDFGSNLSVSPVSAGVVTVTASGGGGGGVNYWQQTVAGIHTLSNVGIGTTNPTSSLTVSGNVYSTGIVTTDAGQLVNGFPTFIQNTQPTIQQLNGLNKYLWWDTTGGNLTLWIETGN